MKAKPEKTLIAIFSDPVNGNIEGSGSSVTFEKDGIRSYFHRPHPAKAALRYRVRDARKFLKLLGVTA